MAAKIDAEKCTGCEACVDSCPVEAIKMVDGKAVIDEDACVDCGACVGECPTEAIEMEQFHDIYYSREFFPAFFLFNILSLFIKLWLFNFFTE